MFGHLPNLIRQPDRAYIVSIQIIISPSAVRAARFRPGPLNEPMLRRAFRPDRAWI
jgi:hypothetical protein